VSERMGVSRFRSAEMWNLCRFFHRGGAIM